MQGKVYTACQGCNIFTWLDTEGSKCSQCEAGLTQYVFIPEEHQSLPECGECAEKTPTI